MGFILGISKTKSPHPPKPLKVHHKDPDESRFNWILSVHATSQQCSSKLLMLLKQLQGRLVRDLSSYESSLSPKYFEDELGLATPNRHFFFMNKDYLVVGLANILNLLGYKNPCVFQLYNEAGDGFAISLKDPTRLDCFMQKLFKTLVVNHNRAEIMGRAEETNTLTIPNPSI